jgi:hypothetical protein
MPGTLGGSARGVPSLMGAPIDPVTPSASPALTDGAEARGSAFLASGGEGLSLASRFISAFGAKSVP